MIHIQRILPSLNIMHSIILLITSTPKISQRILSKISLQPLLFCNKFPVLIMIWWEKCSKKWKHWEMTTLKVWKRKKLSCNKLLSNFLQTEWSNLISKITLNDRFSHNLTDKKKIQILLKNKKRILRTFWHKTHN